MSFFHVFLGRTYSEKPLPCLAECNNEPKCSVAVLKQLIQEQKFEYEIFLECLSNDRDADGFPDNDVEPSIGTDIYYKVTDQKTGGIHGIQAHFVTYEKLVN